MLDCKNSPFPLQWVIPAHQNIGLIRIFSESYETYGIPRDSIFKGMYNVCTSILAIKYFSSSMGVSCSSNIGSEVNHKSKIHTRLLYALLYTTLYV